MKKAVIALEQAINNDIDMIARHPYRIRDVVNNLANMINIQNHIKAKAAVPKKAPVKAKGDKK